MNLPRITVVTPSFNQGHLIEETINSILDQNYPNLEYIVIDGGSTDATLEVIKKYEHKIDYWTSETDGGQSEAINKGLRRATGDIVTWLNSDDLFLPDVLQTVARYFNEYDAALIHGRTVLFGNGTKELIKGAEDDDLEVRYLSGMAFPQPSSFFKKRVLDEQGVLDESLHYGMDYDLMVKIALNYCMLKVDDVFSRYRLHGESKTVAQNIRFAYDWAKVFSKVLRSFDFTADLIEHMRALELYVEGRDYYRVTKRFSPADIRKAFLHFLDFQVIWYYGNLDMKKTVRISMFVKDYEPQFYKLRGLATPHRRSKLLGKSGIKFLRTFTR
ncbi:MAG: glycosyltransferase family 2 protein [Pyrinomonadaceae bacterium]